MKNDQIYMIWIDFDKIFRLQKSELKSYNWQKSYDQKTATLLHRLLFGQVVIYCKTSTPLRAMRIPQGVFGARWGKNITHALSKKTRLIILRQKLKKLLAFQRGYFFLGHPV